MESGVKPDPQSESVAPVLVGAWLNHRAPNRVRRTQTGLPLVSVIVIALICASIIGANADAVKSAALRLFGAVFSLHVLGFVLGYVAASLMGCDVKVARTV